MAETKWVDCYDALPGLYDYVLIVADENQVVAATLVYGGEWHDLFNDTNLAMESVRWWMPMPKKPEWIRDDISI